jgi:dephospho-CoA kinase
MQDNLPSLGIIGRSGAGKSTFANYVSKKFPFYHKITVSGIWTEYARELGFVRPGEYLNHDQRTKLAATVTLEQGEMFLVNRLLEKLKHQLEQDANSRFLIDGLRNIQGMKPVRDRLDGNLIYVGIVADSEVRLERAIMREGRGYTHEKFDQREQLNSIYRLYEMIEMCDRIVTNNGDKDKFFEKIDDLMSSLGEFSLNPQRN